MRGIPLTTREPRVTVDAGLKPGVRRFRLVVIDDGGNASPPDEILVEVRDWTAPPGALGTRIECE